MRFPIYSYCKFHFLKYLKAQPLLFSALIIVFALNIVSGVIVIEQWMGQVSANHELNESLISAQKSNREKINRTKSDLPTLDLPIFQNGKLLNILYSANAELKINLEDVSYSLDENVNQPFLRYRIVFTVLSRYKTIKKLITLLQKNTNHIFLDAISCNRDDIDMGELSCDLTFSAYFKKTLNEN